MKIQRNKTLTTMASVLMLTVAALMAGMPSVKAAEIPTYAFLSVAPNPVGVNQPVSVMFWLDSAPPTAAGAVGDRWEGFKVTIEKPDGTTETKGPYRSDPVGGAYFAYTPTSVGTYKFQFSFPGQTVGGNYYKPSTSSKVELTVQEEPIEAWPDYPLPTDYWERPINAENREWYKIAGNWLMPAYNYTFRPFDSGSAFNPYTTAPNSPHIVWTKPITFGGIVGGEFGYGGNYYTGMSYEMKFTPPVIINGRLYYNVFEWGGFTLVNRPGVVCVDLRTGEEIWRKEEMPQIGFGQIFNYDSPNQHGAMAYLWSTATTDWKMYDAFTGTLLLTIKNAPLTVGGGFSTNVVFGPNGEVLVYILDGENNRLVMWNSTKAIPAPTIPGPFMETMKWMWRPGLYPELDWKGGIEWNVSIPDVPGVQGLGEIGSGVIVAEAIILPGPGEAYPTFVHVAYDATTGKQLWVQNRTNMGWGPGGPGYPGYFFLGVKVPIGEGVYALYQKETLQWHAFDIRTGNKLWSTEPLTKFTNSDWSMYDCYGVIAYGKLFTAGYSGCVNAFDLKTGKHLWTFSVGSSGYETPYGTWPFYGGIVVADGKLYAANGEHSPDTPMWRGEKLYCINAESGEGLWNISGWFIGNSLAVADGYLVGYNGYDNQIYCFGKGKTAAEVSVSMSPITKGSSTVIQGRVTDQSAGQPGTPAVSKESMSAWMEYLYMQKPCPMDVTGVPVILQAKSLNGTIINIATVTGDGYGCFAYEWTPPEEDLYTIMAIFTGSGSYWPSYAQTPLGVTAAPPVAAAPAYTGIDLAIIAAVIVAIIIGIANILAIRKLRK